MLKEEAQRAQESTTVQTVSEIGAVGFCFQPGSELILEKLETLYNA
jgi:hypothetical protein